MVMGRLGHEKLDWLLVWCLTPLLPVIQLYRGGQCTYPCFPGVLLTNTTHNILATGSLLSHITIVEATDSGERGMNPVAMTISNPRKEYWRSRDRTSNLCFQVRKSYRLSYGTQHERWDPHVYIFAEYLTKTSIGNGISASVRFCNQLRSSLDL